MSFFDLHHRVLDQNILTGALLELTYRCNLNCYICYNDTSKKESPLAREDYFRLLEDLRDMNALEIALTGGEPLASPHFFSIGSKARELGFVVRIKSNAHALRGKLAQRVKDEIDPFMIDVSLHGACPATHDRQTRVPGSFERLVSNIRELKALGLRIKLNSPLTRWNVGEVEDMFALADSLEVPLRFDSQITPRDDGDAEPMSINVTDAELEYYYRIETERKLRTLKALGVTPAGRKKARTGSKQCGTGSGGVAVDPFGNVYPCVQWRRAVGNLHQRSIKDIWHGSEDLVDIRTINAQVKTQIDNLGGCAQEAGFCMGLAAMQTGDPFHLYEGYKQRLAVRRKLAAEQPESMATGCTKCSGAGGTIQTKTGTT